MHHITNWFLCILTMIEYYSTNTLWEKLMYKKTVILTSIDGGKEKAVLNLEKAGIEINGYLRLYNFNSEPKGILSLGFLSGGNVKKVALNKKCDMQYTFVLEAKDELQNFTCALVNIDEARIRPILQGATSGEKSSEEKLAGALRVFEVAPTVENVQKVLDDNEIELEDQESIEQQVDELMSCIDEKCDKCVSCKYRSAFYNDDEKEMANSQSNENENDDTFFDGIKEQIQNLFDKYPEEEFLNDIIPNSKWVKIDYEQNGEYYVVGLMYEDDKIKYVCYGVPGMYAPESPKELSGFSQWLPLDSTKPQGFGYWITYQDADSGENIKMQFNVV